MGPKMSSEFLSPFESLIALVALEWSFPRMLPHVLLQSPRSSASVVALVTVEQLFSDLVLSHHVNFQFCSFNARILAHCASLWLFTRVPPLVLLQLAFLYCFVFTLIAVVPLVPSVLLDVRFKGVGSVA